MDKINYDVLIPARDEENNIKKTLESIRNQTVKPNSIIVVNDNSKDETERIAIIQKMRQRELQFPMVQKS